MFNVCNHTHDFLTQILNFFKLLVKNTRQHQCTQITPSRKCDKNQLCNNVTNTVKHTIPIIISLFVFIKDVTQKPLKMKDLNFF